METMDPSPRGSTQAFQQTWNEADAASFDTASLPIAKPPRAWDRKQEVKTVANGKQRKVWRRYATRSQSSSMRMDEDMRDSRAQAVKRLQCLSPKAMEQSAALRIGRKHAFKTTRWDRRRSVLPSKSFICYAQTRLS